MRKNKDAVKQIRKLVQQLQSAGIGKHDVLFAEHKKFYATSKDHKEARYPNMGKYQQNYLYSQDLREFNAAHPRTKIVSLPVEGIDRYGNKVKKWFRKIPYGKDALKAKDHQDILNAGGIRKSEDFQAISVDSTLRIADQRRLKEILRRAGIQ